MIEVKKSVTVYCKICGHDFSRDCRVEHGIVDFLFISPCPVCFSADQIKLAKDKASQYKKSVESSKGLA